MFLFAGAALKALLVFPVANPAGCAQEASANNDDLLRAVQFRADVQPVEGITAFPAVRPLIQRIIFPSRLGESPLGLLPEFSLYQPLCQRFWKRVENGRARAAEVRARMQPGSSEYVWECGVNSEMLAPYLCLQDENGTPFGELQGGYVTVSYANALLCLFRVQCWSQVFLCARSDVMPQSRLIRFTPLLASGHWGQAASIAYSKPPLASRGAASVSSGAVASVKAGELAVSVGAGGFMPQWLPDIMFQDTTKHFLLAAREAKKALPAGGGCDMYR